MELSFSRPRLLLTHSACAGVILQLKSRRACAIWPAGGTEGQSVTSERPPRVQTYVADTGIRQMREDRFMDGEAKSC